jgi:predicted PurR-regulated permease PerM
MSKRSKVAVIVTMVVIVVGVGAFYLVSPLFISTQSFANSFESVVNETRLLSLDYDAQVQKWQRGEHSNESMASITDTYLPRYQELINRTNDLQTPTGYENVTNLYAKSLESELKSNIQFRDYLLTGNKTESEASMQSLSDAFRYEIESFKAFKSASNATKN